MNIKNKIPAGLPVRKLSIVLLSLILALSLAGCGSGSKTETAAAEEKIDVDLSSMSATMVYSKVYDMVYYPENYIGQTVKMTGYMTSLHLEDTGMDYYSCIIQDATACCAQGIEFILKDKSAEYPEDGDVITVVGQFDTYEEDGYEYCTLRDASLV